MTFVMCKAEYENYLTGRGFKNKTITAKFRKISYFLSVLPDEQNIDLRQIGEADFIRFLDILRERDLSTGTIAQYTSSIRQLFNWLYKNDLILTPVAELVPSVKAYGEEKTIFTTTEIDLFLDTVGTNLRDRTFFELLYSSGLRCFEALKLRWRDVLMSRRRLKVEEGKGGYDRYVPFCNTAKFFLTRWKKASGGYDNDYIFPGLRGGHLTYSCMAGRFRKYLKESKIEKNGLSIHSIRHSCATHLLEAGAGVRYVSELLGHNCMETTVRYTHPSEESQRKAYRMYHPRENSYFKEIDEEYQNSLTELRRKFEERADYVARYVNK